MSWLTSVLGNVAGSVLGKFASSAIDSHYSGQVIDKQLKAQKELFEYENRNKHQLEVQDLRDAGLNPILSATNGNAIGVGGVSAPNWTSDDDVFSPSAARQIQEKQVKAQEMSAEAALLQAKNGQVASSAKANLDNTSATIAWMKADAEINALYKGLQEKDATIKYLGAKYTEAIDAAAEHRAGAKQKLEDAVGKNLSNKEFESFVKLVKDLEKDPGMQGTATLSAMQVAMHLPHLSREERIPLIASLTDWRRSKVKSHKHDVKENANSASSAFDDIIKNYVD